MAGDNEPEADEPADSFTEWEELDDFYFGGPEPGQDDPIFTNILCLILMGMFVAWSAPWLIKLLAEMVWFWLPAGWAAQ